MTNHAPAPTPPPASPIPVICDLCRAHGQAGDDPFAAFGALLDFDPVPRRKHRANGWDAEVQRAYIAALSLTGSKRAACRAVGRSAFSVEQLLACPGSEGFRAAHDEAMAIAAGERSRRLAEGLRTVAAEQSGWRPADPPWARAEQSRSAGARAPARRDHPPAHGLPAHGLPAPPEPSPRDKLNAAERWLTDVLGKYLLKVEAERTARLAGRIVEADFYLRQMTWIEVVIDMASGDGSAALAAFRAEGFALIEMAETPFSQIMGEIRRQQWAIMGDPPRPEHPPARYLKDHGRFSTEPTESTWGGRAESHAQQRERFEERHRQDAAEQLRWEAEARQDYERRRAASPLVDEEPGSAVQPDPGCDPGDRTDVTD